MKSTSNIDPDVFLLAADLFANPCNHHLGCCFAIEESCRIRKKSIVAHKKFFEDHFFDREILRGEPDSVFWWSMMEVDARVIALGLAAEIAR